MKRALDALLIEKQHLTVVSQFATDIISLGSEEQVLWHVAKHVVAKLGLEDVVIYIFDETTNQLIQRAAHGNKSPSQYVIVNPLKINLGVGVVGDVGLHKRSLRIGDTRQFPGYIVDDDCRLSELAVPMLNQGQLIGVIDSEHPTVNYYTKEHQRTLEAIASIASTKLITSRNVIKLQHTISQLEYTSKIQNVLFEISELIFETDNLLNFYQRLHACIAKLTLAKNFFVALANDDSTELRIPYCIDELDETFDEEFIPITGQIPSITGYVIRHNQALLCNEQKIKQMLSKKIIYVVGSMPKSWMGVPFGEGKIRGAVVVQSYDNVDAFSQQDLQLLSFVARHIYNAIERFQAKSELQFLALHDPLTKLPNRSLFADRVEHALENSQRDARKGLAVLFLDLDKFKQVNDNFGHHIGDQLLVQVSAQIRQCLRASDTLCRLGGDEFAILLENIPSINAAKQIANKIIAQLRLPLRITHLQIVSSVSIGITYFTGGNTDAKSLLVEADEAMYQAKIHGRDQVFCYQDKRQFQQSSSSYKLTHDFSQSLKDKEFFMVFQPIQNLLSGRISGAEALVRWQHNEKGLIAPDLFINELEKTGQITELDLYVLDKALTFLDDNLPLLPEDFRLSVNISAAGFASQELSTYVLAKHNTKAHLLARLTIEITEQSIVQHIERTKEVMSLFAKLGIKLSLDDFGTGYSSLSYLHMFKFDILKIDRCFVANIAPGANQSIIISAIIGLAKSLNIETTAEGIETAYQYNAIKEFACTHGQGYYISRPTSAEQLLAHIASNT